MVIGFAVVLFLGSLQSVAGQAGLPCPPASSTKDLAREATSLLASSRYSQAELVSLCAEARVRAEDNRRLLARILNNLGVARLYQQNFQGAYAPLQEAAALSRQLGIPETEASAWSNLATVYSMLSAWPAAEQALNQALSLMPPGSRFRPAVLAQRVRLARQRPDLRPETFASFWSEAMEGAEQAGDWQVQRHLWDELFKHHLEAGRLELAEAALANSFRLAALHRLPDKESLWMLAGRLRLAEGRPAEALAWLARVQASGAVQNHPVNALSLAAAEARAAAAAHGSAAALAACRRNWARVMEWRRAVLPDPSVELAADVAMTELIHEYVSAAFSARGGPSLEVEAWAAVEQSRALGMLRRKKRQPDAESGQNPGGAGVQQLTALPRQSPGESAAPFLRTVSSIRSSTSVHAPSGAALAPHVLLHLVQRSLNRNQALFTFWLGRNRSILWVTTEDSFSAVEIPGRDELRKQFQQFGEEISAKGDANALASRLYSATFGRAPAQARQRREWLISADEEPLAAPVSALRMSDEDSRWLGGERALSFLPSALWLFEPGRNRPASKLLAIGGAVHNSADPRWGAFPRAPSSGSAADPASAGRRVLSLEPEYELPTLPGSSREVETIAALWTQCGLQARQMMGFDATEAAFRDAMQQDWSDLHFATHIQPAPAPLTYRLRSEPDSGVPALIRFPAGEPFLALSLRRDGVRDGLTERALARVRLDGARVVLNGCSTGGGPAQRGAGLSSFAHAWLAAGARSVIASLWPVADDGTFFESYYKALLQGERPAAALHAAQAAMIRSGTWRSQPSYWAAYIHLGKD